MKPIKILFSTLFVMLSFQLSAQYVMRLHNSGNLVYQQQVSILDSIKFAESNSNFYPNTGWFLIPNLGIDSFTFSTANTESEIYIIYSGSSATIINPFESEGVSITDSLGHVTVTSTYSSDGLRYHILGTSANGSLKITSTHAVQLILTQANITNPSGAALALNGGTESNVFLSAGTVNTFNDASTSTASGAFYASGNITISGTGSLNVNGYKKHGILADASLTVASGIINVANAASDGIHANDFTQSGGDITIVATGDGIDASNTLNITNGSLDVTANTNDIKGLKATTISISNGNIVIKVAGNQSKAIKSSGNTTISGGTLTITASGTVVLEESGSGYDPSYCTGIKSDIDVIISGGNINITCPSSNAGGKGISADGNITISGGNVNITTAGNGATYVNESGVQDSYSATCISADANIAITAGSITCASSGTAGKGINADSAVTLGSLGASDALLTINVSTSGARFYVSGVGEDADYANPKAIKADGNLTVNSGKITVNCTTEGGEGLESKSSMYIKGGQITATTVDDCLNASNYIQISGGTHSLTASNNDGIDSNDSLTVTGGLIISKGAGGPEEGFDCDMNQFRIAGGILVGTGGNTSTPTTSVSTKNALKLSINPDQNICIKNAAGETILIYALPALSSSGGPGGPGGSTKIVMLFSDPLIINGSYTLYYGGTISGGTNFNGYYTGATYSGGSTHTFTVSSKYTTISL